MGKTIGMFFLQEKSWELFGLALKERGKEKISAFLGALRHSGFFRAFTEREEGVFLN